MNKKSLILTTVLILSLISGCGNKPSKRMVPAKQCVDCPPIDRKLQTQLLKGMDWLEVVGLLGTAHKWLPASISDFTGGFSGRLDTYTYKVTPQPGESERMFLMLKFKNDDLYVWDLVSVDGIFSGLKNR